VAESGDEERLETAGWGIRRWNIGYWIWGADEGKD